MTVEAVNSNQSKDSTEAQLALVRKELEATRKENEELRAKVASKTESAGRAESETRKVQTQVEELKGDATRRRDEVDRMKQQEEIARREHKSAAIASERRLSAASCYS